MTTSMQARIQEAVSHAKGRADRLRLRGMEEDAAHYAAVAEWLSNASPEFWTKHATGRGVEQIVMIAGDLMAR